VKRRNHTPEPIIRKLAEGDKLLNDGSDIAAVAEMERDLLVERTRSGLAASRARGRKGRRRPSLTKAQARRVEQMYEARDLTVAEIAASMGVSRQTIYRYLPNRAA
jgi:DNA invertase Pin-like site-specific DNA recombinase